MGKILALAAALTLVVPLRPSAAPRAATKRATARPRPLTDLEKESCSAELRVLDRRVRFFQGQGLGPAEIARRNELPRRTLGECLSAFRRNREVELERLEDMNELDRRVGPDASEAARAEAWAQIQRERLAGKPRSLLTPAEKAELTAGSKAEEAETHATLDTFHAGDPAFMRMVHSALACHHGVRRDKLRDQLAVEQARVRRGGGDRRKIYALQARLKQTNEVLARSHEASRQFKNGLRRCTEEQVAVLTRCLTVQFEERPAEPACESEEIQQYIRFIK